MADNGEDENGEGAPLVHPMEITMAELNDKLGITPNV